MMARKRRGFTLIELLVVIAIIAILAAMLFPVFARARESARKIQCLANVKNIATAIQMYLTDYDRGPSWEHRPEVYEFFATRPGGGPVFDDPCGQMTDHANPYMRYPVILDEYVRNRQVWNCPSAKIQAGAMFIYGDPDWFRELVAHKGEWGSGKDICPKDGCFPNGWGGAITDSFIQKRHALEYWAGDRNEAASQTFIQSIGVNFAWSELKTSQVQDATAFVVCHDAGACVDYDSPGLLAYPDLCAAECNSEWCAWAPWDDPGGCGSYCGDFMYNLPPRGGAFAKDPELMKPYTRHLGGSNIGWMDGHASWMSARAFVSSCIEQGKKGIPNPYGMWPWSGGYPEWCDGCDPCIARFYKPGG